MSGNLSDEQITDADIYGEILEREESVSREQREKEEWSFLLQKRKTKKGRVDIEKMFIGKVLYYAGRLGGSRGYVAGFKISWRNFIDPRHRVIWRVLETYDLLSTVEREKIAEEEAYGELRECLKRGCYLVPANNGGAIILEEKPLHGMHYDGVRGNNFTSGGEEVDILRGLPGSALDMMFKEYIKQKAAPVKRLERALEETGGLAIAGGKIYLREAACINDFIFSDTKLADLLFNRYARY